MTLEDFNRLSDSEMKLELKQCCGSSQWVHQMMQWTPFSSWEVLALRAKETWDALEPKDWLEAFAAHPRIGGIESSHSQSTTSVGSAGSHHLWASQEQQGMQKSSKEVLSEFALKNREYEKRFGHIFLVCATGKTAEEMMALLNERLDNLPQEELKIAVQEQAKIIEIRLRKLFKLG